MTATTTRFNPQTTATAPEASRETLAVVSKKFGFVPNLMGTLANSPSALDAYLALDKVLNKGTFSPQERQIIALAASVENECGYCIAAHSTILKGQLKLDAEAVAAIRSGSPLSDAKLSALVGLVREVVRERGQVSDATVQAFLAAGYEEHQLLEVLVGVAMKTISNYLDHISPVEVDDAFASEK